jgi:hypothetical protein
MSENPMPSGVGNGTHQHGRLGHDAEIERHDASQRPHRRRPAGGQTLVTGGR